MNEDQPITMTKNIFTVGCARLLNAASPTRKWMDEYLPQESFADERKPIFVLVRGF